MHMLTQNLNWDRQVKIRVTKSYKGFSLRENLIAEDLLTIGLHETQSIPWTNILGICPRISFE
jgi:hypothetical protein